jgi:hypothetical protein
MRMPLFVLEKIEETSEVKEYVIKNCTVHFEFHFEFHH